MVVGENDEIFLIQILLQVMITNAWVLDYDNDLITYYLVKVFSRKYFTTYW
jgi:hypothetical protein